MRLAIKSGFSTVNASSEFGHVFLTGDVGVAATVLKMETRMKMHMKEWLIAQIESRNYRGLSWENDEKTMFRIPWKHAAKKDYSQTADAALFKVRSVPLDPDSNPVILNHYLHPNSVSDAGHLYSSIVALAAASTKIGFSSYIIYKI